MSEEKAIVREGGISFTGVLFIVFLILKLTGTITWSWWWVTAPLWGPLVIMLGMLGIIGIIALIVMMIVGLNSILGD